MKIDTYVDDLDTQDDNPELELAILGCHKDFKSIVNSKIICRNEGFTGVDVKYLVGLWVLFTFQDKKVRDCFLKHEGILSWFSSLKLWHNDFVLHERLVWLEIEGVPVRAWNDDTFKSICKKWGEVMFIDNSDSSNRFTIRVCIKSSHQLLIFASTSVTLNKVSYSFRVRELCSWTPTFTTDSNDVDDEGFMEKEKIIESDKEEEDDVESVGDFNNMEGNGDFFTNKEDENVDLPINSDPFELESLIAKKGNYHATKKDTDTPKFPPGFTQSDNGEDKQELSDINKPDTMTMQSSDGKIDEIPKKYFGVSMLQQVEDTIKVNTALGFNMDGCQDMLQIMIADMGDKFVVK
ncbi:hypothetical protein CTI12_AA315420 [Artemisia annua]|uniref:DUF4283 domain-containing protein n=1 Tax=Artemisia annua TaxID=35608 RepID=A0A2U1N2F8_ARTAN|nr:hypothetical protein CTI12_AA315420 [Artemisia annua]